MKLLILSAVSLMVSAGHAAPSDSDKAFALVATVREQCQLPERIPSYPLSKLERFVAQVVFPELKMLNTAFLVGFEAMNSSFLDLGYCVITFMGLPNDPEWEKQHDFYKQAVAHGTLPKVMFAGFDGEGRVLLRPMEKTN